MQYGLKQHKAPLQLMTAARHLLRAVMCFALSGVLAAKRRLSITIVHLVVSIPDQYVTLM